MYSERGPFLKNKQTLIRRKIKFAFQSTLSSFVCFADIVHNTIRNGATFVFQLMIKMITQPSIYIICSGRLKLKVS